ncbi:thioredoxin-dependent thiol peroxidase [Aquicella lusitana]|uniref:thioredoxin-dependent peroxiredoxin n=1 Tax=Aquicella lusitana TaxID=254246 RepID=A0A370GY42_9COXI|nr:thioredoxin-dependent thiol peroxidase [Aquicella lusitana]RDI48577.1 peroxiredoxin Q/BCP [Aquicella lusitana]VVC74046.1 Putative peroxiredoxin bcp [Aquicella lusitana]
MTLKIGDMAPDFTLSDDREKNITLSHLRGKKVVLFFYPKDNTPGCTREACDFRDQFAAFTKQGVEVFGISKDSAKAHTKFKEKYGLPFPLLVDANADVCEAYGVINKKSMFGKTFLGIQRSTFLIDEQGAIRGIWRKVKVPGHVEQVLNEIQ